MIVYSLLLRFQTSELDEEQHVLRCLFWTSWKIHDWYIKFREFLWIFDLSLNVTGSSARINEGLPCTPGVRPWHEGTVVAAKKHAGMRTGAPGATLEWKPCLQKYMSHNFAPKDLKCFSQNGKVTLEPHRSAYFFGGCETWNLRCTCLGHQKSPVRRWGCQIGSNQIQIMHERLNKWRWLTIKSKSRPVGESVERKPSISRSISNTIHNQLLFISFYIKKRTSSALLKPLPYSNVF